MKKTLLIIGDKNSRGRILDHSFNEFIENIEKIKSVKFKAYVISYKDVFSGKLPEVTTPVVNVVLFFPYKYWDENIEVYKKGSKVYGDNAFGHEFKKYFIRLEKAIRKRYRDKKIEYVNPPSKSILDRDNDYTEKLFLTKCPYKYINYTENYKY